ncbi:MAG: zinc ribbon domain-containing protein [Anaerolineae bacterium]|nr:zinc ribbon domain-containing protein [Anaerolineae bacterium]NUQ03660.1 zinc ribbon domain-containing protein [Anaerolineae bacterium]
MSEPDRIENLGTYEMIWDCKFCGTQSLPAKTHKFCPNCGAAQDARSRRFPSDDEKKAVENYVSQGADLICPACSTPNAATAKFCQQCGAPMEGAQKVETLHSQVRDQDEKFQASEVRSVDNVAYEKDLRAAGVLPNAAAGGSKTGLYVLIGIGALAIIAILVAIFWRKDASAVVAGHEWERSIDIQTLSAVPGGTWCDSMPFDAYNISRSREQRSSRSIPVGEECGVRRIDNGDGTFSERRECQTVYEEEPIYDDYCSFVTNQWVYARSVEQMGESLTDAPRWPLLQLNSGTCLGCEREGGRSESYAITLQAGDKTYTCQVPYAFWEQADVGSAWNFKVSVITGRPDCGSLEPTG